MTDVTLFTYLNSLPARAPALGRLAVAAAQDGIFLYPLLLLWLWVRPGQDSAGGRRLVLLALLAAALSLGLNAALNVIMPRPRPFLVLPAHVLVPRSHDASFPSDHAAVAAAIGFALLVCGRAAWGMAAVLGAALIGTARVMVGVHYPSDIAGGIAAGAVCAAAVSSARRVLQPPLDRIVALGRRFRLG